MERRELTVELRGKTGKGISRRLRVKGMIPGIVYGKGMESVPVSLNPKELNSALAGEGGCRRARLRPASPEGKPPRHERLGRLIHLPDCSQIIPENV